MREFRLLRLEQAREQLQSSDRTIDQIAEGTGYFDRGTFSRAFHRVFGFYPGHFRSRLRQKLQSV
jgi:transcriptional regulator GlxA family with amidase domain